MGEAGVQASPFWENKEYLTKLMMSYCGITDEDLHKTDVVKQKVRQAGINFVLEGN